MKTLIISESSPFTSLLEDFISLLKPDELVEIADLFNGLVQCHFSSPDIVLYDSDLLEFRRNWPVQNLRFTFPTARLIVGFTGSNMQSVEKHKTDPMNVVFSKDNALNQLGIIYCDERFYNKTGRF